MSLEGSFEVGSATVDRRDRQRSGRARAATTRAGRSMIARVWTARATASNASRYAAHLRDDVLPLVRKMPGYAGATLLERVRRRRQSRSSSSRGGDRWTTFSAFAGADISRAVVTDEASALLAQFDRAGADTSM